MAHRVLLIMRHAKSSWEDPILADHDRPLKKRGKRDALKMGTFLLENHLNPDLVLCSTARRARQTARRTCGVLGISKNAVRQIQSLYGAGLMSLLEVLGDIPETARRVLLVGHNPGLEDLTRFLGGDQVIMPEDGKLLTTAALAHFEMPESWINLERGGACLKTIVRPKTL